ncbi:hypothetical protein [Microcoleus sp. herbarium13]|uniref:hypothetical protein n=1 Tax=Microcoleus sp. herbarium13 TaxID=3055438 RepID=UPI002FD3826A
MQFDEAAFPGLKFIYYPYISFFRSSPLFQDKISRSWEIVKGIANLLKKVLNRVITGDGIEDLAVWALVGFTSRVDVVIYSRD